MGVLRVLACVLACTVAIAAVQVAPAATAATASPCPKGIVHVEVPTPVLSTHPLHGMWRTTMDGLVACRYADVVALQNKTKLVWTIVSDVVHGHDKQSPLMTFMHAADSGGYVLPGEVILLEHGPGKYNGDTFYTVDATRTAIWVAMTQTIRYMESRYATRDAALDAAWGCAQAAADLVSASDGLVPSTEEIIDYSLDVLSAADDCRDAWSEAKKKWEEQKQRAAAIKNGIKVKVPKPKVIPRAVPVNTFDDWVRIIRQLR